MAQTFVICRHLRKIMLMSNWLLAYANDMHMQLTLASTCPRPFSLQVLPLAVAGQTAHTLQPISAAIAHSLAVSFRSDGKHHPLSTAHSDFASANVFLHPVDSPVVPPPPLSFLPGVGRTPCCRHTRHYAGRGL